MSDDPETSYPFVVVARQAENWPEVVLKDSPTASVTSSPVQEVAKVPNGESLTVLQESGEYRKVRWKGKVGWAKAANLAKKVVAANQSDHHPEIFLFDLPSSPDDREPLRETVGKVHNGEHLTVLEENGTDWKVRLLKKDAWAKAANFNETAKVVVAKQAEDWPEVVLKDSPGSTPTGTGKSVARVKNGEFLVVKEENGEYCKVLWRNRKLGWAKTANLAPAPGVVVAEQAKGHDAVSLKNLPGTGGVGTRQVVGKVHNGDFLTVLEKQENYWKVCRHGKEGWAKATNLEATAQPLPPPGESCAVTRVAWQTDNHPEVVMRDAPTLRDPNKVGKFMQMIPNGAKVTIRDDGAGTESVKVSWQGKEGWVMRNNLQRSAQSLPRAKSKSSVDAETKVKTSRGVRNQTVPPLSSRVSNRTLPKDGLQRMHTYSLSDGMLRSLSKDCVDQQLPPSPSLLEWRMGDFGQKLPEEPKQIKSEEDLRKKILLETLRKFESEGLQCHKSARENLRRWRTEPKGEHGDKIQVVKGDWAEITGRFVEEYGEIFAALNMANAYAPGGGYTDGLIAQEENMFRRTDCHFSLTDQWMARGRDTYHSFETDLINAVSGEVYLDTKYPRVCIRGKEEKSHFPKDLGYEWLHEDQYFLFYELRAAAVDLRDGRPFRPEEMRMRIKAQLNTCIKKNVEHVVLSAFGCGAFLNPPDVTAKIYYEEIALVKSKFACIVFAIYHAGYGADNFTPFENAFKAQPPGPEETITVTTPVKLQDSPSGNVIIQVPEGEVLTVLSREGDNPKVRWKISEGWMV